MFATSTITYYTYRADRQVVRFVDRVSEHDQGTFVVVSSACALQLIRSTAPIGTSNSIHIDVCFRVNNVNSVCGAERYLLLFACFPGEHGIHLFS